MGAFVIDGEEYPGRSQGDARRSLDGEPSHVQQDQQAAAAAAATAAAAQHYYASQQRHGSAPPSACEWQQLVASMGSVHLGQQHQQQQQLQQDMHHPYNQPHHRHHHRHHHHEAPRNKRLHGDSATAGMAPYGTYYNHHGLHSGSSDSGSDGRMLDDDEMLLGAPPLLPPTLKRARACSYSPKKTPRDEFSMMSDESSSGDRRQ